jgi:hypothetical protein
MQNLPPMCAVRTVSQGYFHACKLSRDDTWLSGRMAHQFLSCLYLLYDREQDHWSYLVFRQMGKETCQDTYHHMLGNCRKNHIMSYICYYTLSIIIIHDYILLRYYFAIICNMLIYIISIIHIRINTLIYGDLHCEWHPLELCSEQSVPPFMLPITENCHLSNKDKIITSKRD